MIYRFLKKKKYTHLGLAQRFHFLPDSPEAEITNIKQVENLSFISLRTKSQSIVWFLFRYWISPLVC